MQLLLQQMSPPKPVTSCRSALLSLSLVKHMLMSRLALVQICGAVAGVVCLLMSPDMLMLLSKSVSHCSIPCSALGDSTLLVKR